MNIKPLPHQRAFLECNGTQEKEPIRIVFFGGGAGGGKVQPYSSVVHTPFGEKLLRDVKIGDTLLNPDGTNQKVIQIYPHENHQFYKVTFDDGAVTFCGIEHLWNCWRTSRDTKRGKNLDSKYGKDDLSLYPNKAEIKDLAGIKKWMEEGYNVRIPVSQPLHYTVARKDHLDCYLLGLLIGDGSVVKKKAIIITSDPTDCEIDLHIKNRGFSCYRTNGSPKTVFFNKEDREHIASKLEKYGLLGTYSHNKFIPSFYQYLPIDKRIDLLQGLMDTDGYCDERGHLEYTTVSPQLSKDFVRLVRGLGGKCTVNTKTGSYKDKKGNIVECRKVYRHYIKLPNSVTPFKLKRKRNRLVPHVKRLSRRIEKIELSHKGDGCCIVVSNPNSLYVTDDTIVTHNTWAILLDNLLGVHDPDYYSVFFRSTNNELETNLWPAAKKMYHPFLFRDEQGNEPIGKAHVNEQKMIITFPSGAKSKFSYLEYDKHADAWYGAELCKIYIDEFQMHSEYAFHVLRSRNRSIAKVPKGMRFTLNPDPTHFMYEWIEPFLKQDGSGFPDPSKSAKVRYYLIIKGRLHTSWYKQELIDRFNKEPQTYTYIPATLEDNTVLKEIDPDYYSMLDSLPEDKRDQLLLGCWKDNGDRGVYWKREWLKEADNLPEGRLLTARGYDLAGSEPSLNYKCPDFTVGIKMSKCQDGNFYLWGDYIPAFKNEDSNIEGRVWRNIGSRDKLIADQAEHDGLDVPIILPQDAGSAGKEAFESKVNYFMGLGIVVKKDNSISTQKKLTKADPFFTACQHGKVFILKHTFNSETLDWLFSELERFKGERSGNSLNSKDDAVDAAATVFNYLAREKTYETPLFATLSNFKTFSSDLLNNRRSY